MICKYCGKNKKMHARDLCAQCYWIEYQKDVRKKEKLKADGKFRNPTRINPRKIMNMRPEQIIANWNKILRAVGL